MSQERIDSLIDQRIINSAPNGTLESPPETAMKRPETTSPDQSADPPQTATLLDILKKESGYEPDPGFKIDAEALRKHFEFD